MKVTLFGAPWCAFCQTEKQWLDSKSVSYEYHDVEAHVDALEYVRDVTGSSGIPLTIIQSDDKDIHIVRGFNRQELSQHLGV